MEKKKRAQKAREVHHMQKTITSQKCEIMLNKKTIKSLNSNISELNDQLQSTKNVQNKILNEFNQFSKIKPTARRYVPIIISFSLLSKSILLNTLQLFNNFFYYLFISVFLH